ncbi:MAG: hypothetical protein Q4P13_11795 [Psychrobacter sp.]|nr:hypothetical protein [Psychrobacter sp.]
MKKYLLSLPLLAALISPSYAASKEDSYKINTVKTMYYAHIKALKANENADELDTIYLYSSKELKKAIALVKADAMSGYIVEDEDDISECSESVYDLHLIEGNGYDVSLVDEFDFKMLKNGKVRADMWVGAKRDSEREHYSKDFSLSCHGDTCKITDIFDANGTSAIAEVERSCL